MKDLYEIFEYRYRHWGVAEVHKNGTKIATVNKFYEVTPEWIIIYDTVGGDGIGWNKGDVLQKIFIGDSEFKKTFVFFINKRT